MEQEIESINRFVDALVEFGVSYGFQILGAVVFLIVGLKLAGWAGRKVVAVADAKSMATGSRPAAAGEPAAPSGLARGP